MLALAQLEKIAKQLSTVSTIVDDVKDIRDKAAAIAHYSRQQAGCRQIEREATIIRLRAERRLGELLRATVRAGNPNCSPGVQLRLPAGINRKQSSTWQQASKLPAKDFENYLKSPGTLSSKAVVKLADQHRRRRAAAGGPDSGGNILTGDMWQLHSRLEDGSVHLILTDPPYSDVECYSRLAELAASKLCDGGLCLAYSGKYHLPEIMQTMGEHLNYWWLFAVQFSGANCAIHPRRIQSAWRPILAYARGKPDNPWIQDLLQGGGTAKSRHRWEQPQSEAEYLVGKLTKPGELVCDPYCGSGTVLAAAKKMGRRWIGCELDQTTARGARRRIAA